MIKDNKIKDSKSEKSHEEGGEELPKATEKRWINFQSMRSIYLKRLMPVLSKNIDPDKRRGGEKESAEEAAHKAAWSAVKKEHTKEGGKWVKKDK